MALLDRLDLLDLVNAVIVFTVIEAVALIAWRALRGKGPALRDLAGSLLAGACLMLALRAAVTGQGVGGVAPWLALAGVAHATDLWLRWPRA